MAVEGSGFLFGTLVSALNSGAVKQKGKPRRTVGRGRVFNKGTFKLGFKENLNTKPPNHEPLNPNPTFRLES